MAPGLDLSLHWTEMFPWTSKPQDDSVRNYLPSDLGLAELELELELIQSHMTQKPMLVLGLV